MIIIYPTIWAIKLPPLNSVNAGKLSGRSIARKAQLVQLIISGVWTKPPLIKVSLLNCYPQIVQLYSHVYKQYQKQEPIDHFVK
ncbi:hypothetical protein EKA14_02730 [Bacillus mycoides]|nr:hypothetical protein EKA14_02730 [Bacillus mycoides]